ncbi:helix-turn-helix domain-containing protein [Lentzea flaviverrucosa]|uniref:helix-turn-helix domain-containing protein n=1 Tax=Lentzea flaviverrucosa TaxID=200379 RepID=UPI001B870ADA|nr:helix-turn-helix transcriptional regulator [Lentzea flaviverrucosa]
MSASDPVMNSRPDTEENAAKAKEEPASGDQQERLGERLRSSRENLAVSQQVVADRTGIPRSAISDIEKGKRKVDSLELKKLAAVYGRPVGYFLDEDEEADAGNHTLQVVKRAVAGLSDADRVELERFAQFLRYRKQAGGSEK